MAKNKKKHDPIPESFATIAAAADFWDTHDTSDYEEAMREVELKVDIKGRSFLTALQPDLAHKLMARAREQGVNTETLVNLWLAERLAATKPAA